MNIILKGNVKGEMLKTHGSNVKLRRFFKDIIFTNLETGLKKQSRFLKSTATNNDKRNSWYTNYK